jgi:uncharacterized membrane protein YsdA (DUF1294 family)
MANKGIMEAVLSAIVFLPFGLAVAYARLHHRTTPPFEINLALFLLFAAIIAAIFVAQRKMNLFSA